MSPCSLNQRCSLSRAGDSSSAMTTRITAE
jgi:hypothetical protein